MPDPAANAEVLRSLGGLVRGLSALFWGLPSALIICFYTARAEGIRAFGILPPLVCAGWLAYGLWQLEASSGGSGSGAAPWIALNCSA